MEQYRIIALLSDFGLQDVYVGVIKGTIAKINPQLQLIDLSHAIPPQNIAAGRFCLMNAYPYFPPETVYLAVVDPGVGSQRRGVAIAFSQRYLVGPDNGLFSGILSISPAIAAVELSNPTYWRVSHPSSTFHGRDIFAPVAAHLASGVALAELGAEIAIETLVQISLPELQYTERGITGCIQYIDTFGNLITNIPADAVAGKNWSVVVGDVMIPKVQTYSDGALGEVVSLVGSDGWIEIAVNGGNAKSVLKRDWGDLLTVIYNIST